MPNQIPPNTDLQEQTEFETQKSSQPGFIQTIVSAGFAGLGVAAATFPFEASKKRLQGNEIPGKGREQFTNLVKMIAEKKVPFYGPGFGAFAWQVGPATAIAVGVKKLMGDQKENNLMLEAIKAFGAGAAGATVATVVEGMIRRQQLYSKEEGKNVNAIHALKRMVREHGFASPFQSYLGIAGRDGLFTTYMMFALPQAASFAKSMGWSEPTQYAFQMLVLFSGVPLSHPFDTVATQVQQNFGRETYFQTVSRMYSEDGLRSLYRGISMRAILFPFYACALPKLIDGINVLADKAKVINESQNVNLTQSLGNSVSTLFAKPTIAPKRTATIQEIEETQEKQISFGMN